MEIAYVIELIPDRETCLVDSLTLNAVIVRLKPMCKINHFPIRMNLIAVFLRAAISY